MSEMRNKYIKALNIFFLMLIIASALVYGWAIPQYYLEIYPVIMLLYYFLGFAFVNLYSRALEKTPARATNTYLLLRMLKMLIAVLFAVVYCLVAGHVVQFIIPFAALYLFFLVFDTWFFYQHGSLMKTNKVNDESK